MVDLTEHLMVDMMAAWMDRLSVELRAVALEGQMVDRTEM